MKQHGTYVMYVRDRCRCDDCRRANVEYERQRQRRLAIERFHPDRSKFVDARPIREHLRALMAAGMGTKTIIKRGGISSGTLTGILYGRRGKEYRPPRKRVTRDVADRVLAIKPDVADGQRIDATGTRRRLQALMAIGYSRAYLARALGLSRGNNNCTINGTRTEVTARTARATVELYDRLSLTPGPQTRARNEAARKGWPPPLAWNDDEIDDPRAAAHVGIERPLSAIERCVEDYHDTWAHHGGDIQQAADRLGMDRNHLDKTLSRARVAGIPIRQQLGRTA